MQAPVIALATATRLSGMPGSVPESGGGIAQRLGEQALAPRVGYGNAGKHRQCWNNFPDAPVSRSQLDLFDEGAKCRRSRMA